MVDRLSEKVVETLNVMKVFIIDDDQDDLEIMTEALHDIRPSIESQVCADPEEALTLLQDAVDKPDFILLDNIMPKLRAVEVIEKIRRLPNLIATKIVVLSSDISPADAVILRGLGIEVFKKGIAFKSVVSMLRTILFPKRILYR